MENSIEESPLLRLLPALQRIISLEEVHKIFGMTKSQINIFILLYHRESATMGEVAHYLSSSKEQATRAVSALCDCGFVERFDDPLNRTHVNIKLTEKGKAHMQSMICELNSQIIEKISAALSQDDVNLLNLSVQKTVEILNNVK